MKEGIKFLLIILVLAGFIFDADFLKAQNQNIASELDKVLEIAATDKHPDRHAAILRLRVIGNERAIPVLKKILVEHFETQDIFGFAASQALFCIGTKEAHDILSKYLFSDEYNTDLGIKYTFHWSMEQSKADAFIEQYHLKGTSNDLRIGIRARSFKKDPKQKIEFTVTLRNVSLRPLRIYKPESYPGNLFILRSPSGHFMRRFETVQYDRVMGKESFPVLAPLQALKFRVIAEPCWMDIGFWQNITNPKAFVLDCKDMFHILETPGKFKAYAFFSYDRRFPEVWGKRFGLTGIWSGRVVSKPIEVEILPMEIHKAKAIAKAFISRQKNRSVYQGEPYSIEEKEDFFVLFFHRKDGVKNPGVVRVSKKNWRAELLGTK